jgi:hypothetical protein
MHSPREIRTPMFVALHLQMRFGKPRRARHYDPFTTLTPAALVNVRLCIANVVFHSERTSCNQERLA